jgi:ribosomal protein S18 acetylase RimI-like enzyme
MPATEEVESLAEVEHASETLLACPAIKGRLHDDAVATSHSRAIARTEGLDDADDLVARSVGQRDKGMVAGDGMQVTAADPDQAAPHERLAVARDRRRPGFDQQLTRHSPHPPVSRRPIVGRLTHVDALSGDERRWAIVHNDLAHALS